MEKNNCLFEKYVSRYLQVDGNPKALEKAGELWKEAHTLIDVQTWDTLLDTDEFFERFHPYASSSKALSRLLLGTQQIWLFAASLGGALDRCSKDYFKRNEAFSGFILDRIGSFLIEDKIKELDKKINVDCQYRGWGTTRRYSPGYRDFSLEAQAIFLELIDGNISGLELTSGLLLKPEKTVTALKGVKQLLRQEPSSSGIKI